MPGPEIQFLTVNHDKYIPFSDDLGKGSHRHSKPSLASSSQPRSKPGHPFDLCSILDQLPPNTGPPGTVSVNGSLGSGANSNKNLSHVPCKFFRQGNCQAGNSCPFSHNLDGSLAADKLPCKYFQKGNCKFGLKCALAHFLPDGTRVNSKSLRRQEKKYGAIASELASEQNSSSESSSPHHQKTRAVSQASTASAGTGTPSNGHVSSHIGATPLRQYGPSPTDRIPSRPKLESSQLNTVELGSFDNGRSYLSDPLDIRKSSFGEHDNSHANAAFRNSLLHSSSLTLQLAYYNARTKPITLTSPTANYQSLHDWLVPGSATTTNPFTTSNQNGFGSRLRSFSSTSPTNLVSLPTSIDFSSNLLGSQRTELPQDHFDFQHRLGLLSRSSNAFLTSPSQNNIRLTDEVAILDGSHGEDAIEDDENAFFEDYVPASLGNLILTPQELQRRDSRSQSGTLWVRPNIERSPSDIKKNYGVGNDNDVFLME